MVKSSVTGRFRTISMLALALPAFTSAQSHGGVAPPAPAGRAAAPISRASAAPGNAPVHAGTQTARIDAPVVHSRTPGRVFRNGNHANFTKDFQNVPGLGFDFPHLAAVSGNRHGHGGRFNAGFPFGFSGFLLGSPGMIEEAVAVDPSAAQDQLAADTPDDDSTAPRHSRSSRAAIQPEPNAPPAPPRDVEQYVLVRQDGGLVFAVAYTWENGLLRYITPDGFRRAITRDALDMNATRQFNEQRGLNFRAPA